MFDICPKKLQSPTNDVRSWQEKWEWQLLVEAIHVRGAQILGFYVSHKIYCEFFVKLFYHFVNSYSHATLCASCAKAKAACKPFDTDKACAKARVEVV